MSLDIYKKELYEKSVNDNTLYASVSDLFHSSFVDPLCYEDMAIAIIDDEVFVNFISMMPEYYNNVSKALEYCIGKSIQTGELHLTLTAYGEIFNYSYSAMNKIKARLKKEKEYPVAVEVYESEQVFTFNQLEAFFGFNKIISGFYIGFEEFCDKYGYIYNTVKQGISKYDLKPVIFYHRKPYYNETDLVEVFKKYEEARNKRLFEDSLVFNGVKVIDKRVREVINDEAFSHLTSLKRFCDERSNSYKHNRSSICYQKNIGAAIIDKDVLPACITTDKVKLYDKTILQEIAEEIRVAEAEEKLKNIDKWVKRI